MLQRAEELEKGTVAIKDEDGLRIWVGHGSGDKVCSFEATQKLMDRLEVNDKQLRVYDGWFHKRRSTLASLSNSCMQLTGTSSC